MPDPIANEATLRKARENPMSIWLLLFSVSALALLGGISFFPNYKIWKMTDRETEYFGGRHLAYALHYVPGKSDESPMGASIKRLEEVFGQRLEQYQKNTESLTRNLLYTAIFICLALMVLLRRQESYKIPVLDIEVPRNAALLLVPAGLVILWAQFGFLLSETIDLRMGLWKIAQAVEAPPSAMIGRSALANTGATGAVESVWLELTNIQPTLTSNDWSNAAYTYGHKRVLHDGGFLDGWFNSFRAAYTLRATSSVMVVVHIIIWGIFCGLGNACVLMSVWERAKFSKIPWKRFCHGVLFIGATVYLLSSHWGFMWISGHPNYMQPISLLVCAGLCLFFAIGRAIPKTIVKKISSWFPSTPDLE